MTPEELRTGTRIVRIIARMNVGGPAVEVSSLMRLLPADEFPQVLLTGYVTDDEADYLDRQEPDLEAIRVLGLGRALRPWDDVRALFALRKHLRHFAPDIVHTHTAKAGLLGRLAARSVRPRPRLVHTFHGHVLSGYFPAWANWAITQIERSLARVTDELITVGPEVRSELLNAGIGTPEHFRVIEPGVRLRHVPRRQDARAALGITQERLVVSVVGRLTQIKRPDRMLEAVEVAWKEHGDLLVLVAGDGDLRETTEVRAQALGLPVRFLGWTDDVETVFAASDVALLSSDNEGTPLSLVQAAMLGVPSVATDVGSVRHVVEADKTGWLAEPNSEKLGRALSLALGDGAERAKRGRAAREMLQQRYSVDRFVEQHVALYRNLTCGITR